MAEASVSPHADLIVGLPLPQPHMLAALREQEEALRDPKKVM